MSTEAEEPPREAGKLPTGRIARTARVGGLVTRQGARWVVGTNSTTGIADAGHSTAVTAPEPAGENHSKRERSWCVA